MSNFIYKLNAMEHASQADHPDKMGYAAKRLTVLDHVAALEAENGDLRHDLTRSMERNTQLVNENAALLENAERYKYWRSGVGVLKECGTQLFTYRIIYPIPDTDLMKGSTEEHFDAAIDAARKS